MKKIITLIMWLVLGSLSLNAQDISKQASFTAKSGNINPMSFIGKPEWNPLNEGKNIVVTCDTRVMGAESELIMFYLLPNYTYDPISNQSILQGFKSIGGLMNHGVDADGEPAIENKAPKWRGCQCNAPGYGCQTTACAQSCSIYCSKHLH